MVLLRKFWSIKDTLSGLTNFGKIYVKELEKLAKRSAFRFLIYLFVLFGKIGLKFSGFLEKVGLG